MQPKNKTLPKLITHEERAALAAQHLNHIADDPDALRKMWDALDEPAREHMLSYFADWDIEFCDALNPSI